MTVDKITRYTDILNKIKKNIMSVAVVREDVIDNILICMCNQGHILLEDMPGTGKTTIAKALAGSIAASFKRIQCVPDILPSDITGINYYNQKQGDFVFRKGPIFANIVLADEINRASPRSQAALMECMEERQVTVDNETYLLDEPFIVIATQNPIETKGTFPLPEAQLDRFMMKLSLGYPTMVMEKDILDINLSDRSVRQLKPVCEGKDIAEINAYIKEITLSELVEEYILNIIHATRDSNRLRVGASPRAGVALARASKARALLYGRDFVLPDDVKAMALPVLAHKVIPEYSRSLSQTQTVSTGEIVNEIVGNIKAPVKE